MAITSGLIENDFVVLSPDKTATLETADSSLYERIESNYAGFEGCELVSCHTFDKDWDSWEIHPHGDELVLLLEGEISFVLELGKELSKIHLDKKGMFLIVPRNTWHTAKTRCKTTVLFITPGQGTEHRIENG